MDKRNTDDQTIKSRIALCVGIGEYTNLPNRTLFYAVDDAQAIAEALNDPRRGPFTVTQLTTPSQTTRDILDQTLEHIINDPEHNEDDLVFIYFSCHGQLHPTVDHFFLLPSNAQIRDDGSPDTTTIIDIYQLSSKLAGARVKNIVIFLDVCHSGGIAHILKHLNLSSDHIHNIFLLAAALEDQPARESSKHKHGQFTLCLLRAFAQPAREDWLTVSQLINFISEEIKTISSDSQKKIREARCSNNPNLPFIKAIFGGPSDVESSSPRSQFPTYLRPLLWNVPADPNPFFTGREELLKELAELFSLTHNCAISQPPAISGLGGVGKTQLAIQYAHRYCLRYRSVFWVHADTEQTFITSYTEIYKKIIHILQRHEEISNQTQMVQEVKRWLQDHSDWLLVLDNADNQELVKKFLPNPFPQGGHVLFTTRSQITGSMARSIDVGPLDDDQGALLLLRRSKRLSNQATLDQATQDERIQAQAIAHELGGHPLALNHAGAYIEESSTSLTDYLRLYHTYRADLLDEYKDSNADYPESVATTLLLSVNKVRKANQRAVDFLDLCSFLHPDAIPEEFFLKKDNSFFENELVFNKVIKDLRNHSLIYRNAEDHLLTIHRLIQAVLCNRMSKEVASNWAKCAFQIVQATLPPVEFSQWSLWDRYLPHVLTSIESIKQYQLASDETAEVLRLSGSFLRERARYQEAQPLLEEAKEFYEQKKGIDHPDTATIYNELALLYEAQGQYEQAKQLFENALAIRKKVLGCKHTDTAWSFYELAWLCDLQGQYKSAKRYCQEALAIGRNVLQRDHPAMATILNCLAVIYDDQGNYKQAERYYEQALKIREKVLEPYHPDIAISLNNLAWHYRNQERYELAEPLYQRSLEIDKKVFGSDHPEVAVEIHGLAVVYAKQGNYKQAKRRFEEALGIREKALGPDHPDVAISLNDIAEFYEKQGKYKQAEKHYKRALAIREYALEPGHPDISKSRDNLKRLHERQVGDHFN